MTQSRILLWYRQDLRLHDHLALHTALQEHALVIPVYCFDPRHFGQTSFGFPKTGNLRGNFLRQCVIDLRKSWRSLGSDLVVRCGKPETILPQLCLAWQIDQVFWHQEIASEEKRIETRLRQALLPINVGVQTFWGATLYARGDLPYEIAQLPEVFTHFRKTVEKQASIAASLATPSQLPALPPTVHSGKIPEPEDLGLSLSTADDRGVLDFVGGESAGLERLQQYFWRGDRLRDYKQTRNGLLGADYSSKFSPWLAQGCLSPRYIYAQVKAYEVERIANDSTYWLFFELLWRDYFRWIALKHGNRLFQVTGLQGISIPWRSDPQQFELWRTGNTGYPFIDANMRELSATGFMSNRGRQNVASFLTKNLGIDWRLGAEWFESQLIDYDVYSNWGNWNYSAGVGNDARGFRYFNILKQARDYDLKGEFVRHWVPELAAIPGEQIHQPWIISLETLAAYRINLGATYPKPMIDLQQSVQKNEQIYQRALGIMPTPKTKRKFSHH